MTSQIEICNAALYRLNGQSITSLSDNTKESVILTRIYDATRRRLLRSHPWNFAVKKVELAQLTTAPAFEHTYAFGLPSDCLRVVSVYEADSPWKVVGSEIHSDDSTMYLEYIADITNEGLWDSVFVDVMTLKLAVDMCYAITGSSEVMGQLKQELAQTMREAKQYDAMEDFPRQWDNGTWYDSRN